MTRPCPRCGTSDRQKNGMCRLCRKQNDAASAAKRFAEQTLCKKCGTSDRKRDGACRMCAAAVTKKWYANKGLAYHQKWRQKNAEKVLEINAKYRTAHPDRHAAAFKSWRERNPDKQRERFVKFATANPEKIRQYQQVRQRDKSHLVNAKTNRRRATKLKATPVWANDFFIKEAYALAKLRTEMFGFKWHVDHIVPLRSKVVCGLHVEHNLQVIPALHNLTKSNRSWPHQ